MATVSAPLTAQVFFGRANVIDGDSLAMGDIQFRLFGIDAVEAKQVCQRDGEEWACGLDAAAALRGIAEGKSLNCTQRDRDAYGRVVATCTVNGHDLAEEMVRMGYAVALRDFSMDYVPAEEAAKARSLGIWSSEFQMPRDYRASDPTIAAQNEALLADRKRREREAASQRSSPARSQSSVYYRNCAEARAAGVTPIYRGEPGYGAHMDGDNDGIACEPYRGRR